MKKTILLLAALLLVTTSFAQQKGYEGSVLFSFNGSLNSNEGAYTLETIHGYRFNPFIFLGGGIGLGLAQPDDNTKEAVASAFLSFKANFTKTRVSPFVMLKGGDILGAGIYNRGFYAEPQIGIDINLGDARKCAVVVFAGFQTKNNANKVKLGSVVPERINSIRAGVGFRF